MTIENEWADDIPLIIYSRLTNGFSQKIKDNYKMTNLNNFSDEGTSDAPSKFPFVQFNALAPVETGQDLEGTSINGALFTFQIDVYDNSSKQKARTIMTEVVRLMKSMRFDVVAMPMFTKSDNVHRGTARFRRTIGANDIL